MQPSYLGSLKYTNRSGFMVQFKLTWEWIYNDILDTKLNEIPNLFNSIKEQQCKHSLDTNIILPSFAVLLTFANTGNMISYREHGYIGYHD